MGYFLLRESMLDSLVRARDTFLKPKTGLMMPSHAAMLVAPITDEEERRVQSSEFANAMEDWKEFAETTQTMVSSSSISLQGGTLSRPANPNPGSDPFEQYGVNMNVLEEDFCREQREYYVLSSRWAELQTQCLLADPCVVKEYDMHTCTVEDARGVGLAAGEDEGAGAPFDFDVAGRSTTSEAGLAGPVSGFAGWFTVDFQEQDRREGEGSGAGGSESRLPVDGARDGVHALGTAGVSPSQRDPAPCGPDDEAEWYAGDDEDKGEREALQRPIPVRGIEAEVRRGRQG
ncbi:hypothetical protein THAOC_03857 [Thalassiosira oceanica]|uniref:Uncharacterized protein n=1 Tax=Thalassiosira oceanica TaxID=159749 RepID=K0TPH0_THAOC|nr:hypothetical protein THAOC_03857 [Thalassiosira oceanica]|eukprot:EJK74462.1 hypothetical protein THAOC_03857 [Thalassiosira oceanica]